MKTFTRFTNLIMLLMFGASLASCSNDSNDKEDKGDAGIVKELVGSWNREFIDEDGDRNFDLYTLNADGTGRWVLEFLMDDGSVDVDATTFTWTATSNTIYFNLKGYDDDDKPVIVTWPIEYTISGNKFSLYINDPETGDHRTVILTKMDDSYAKKIIGSWKGNYFGDDGDKDITFTFKNDGTAEQNLHDNDDGKDANMPLKWTATTSLVKLVPQGISVALYEPFSWGKLILRSIDADYIIIDNKLTLVYTEDSDTEDEPKYIVLTKQ